MNKNTAAHFATLDALAEELGYSIHPMRLDVVTTHIYQHRNGATVQVAATVSKAGRTSWRLTCVTPAGEEYTCFMKDAEVILRTRAADQALDAPEKLAAEAELTEFVESNYALRTWYSPGLRSAAVEEAVNRTHISLDRDGTVPGYLFEELRQYAHSIMHRMHGALLRSGEKFFVPDVLTEHAATLQGYTQEELKTAIQAVAKRQGDLTADPHWVRCKLEQELRNRG